MLVVALILIGLGFIDLLITDYGENRILFYLVPAVVFSFIGLSNIIDENKKKNDEKYKNGPVLEVSMSNIGCEEYSYYTKTIYKCNGNVINIK